jgi:Protein of unknown function (DUF998)
MRSLERHALLAGLVPPPWFLAWTTVGGLMLPQYSAISQHSSELLASGGAAAICLRVGAMGSGFAFVAFGAGLWARSGQALAVGAVAWILFGFSMVSNGLWPMGSPMHGLYANLIAPALSHMEVARWLPARRYHALTALVSAAGIFYLWLNLTGNDPEAFRGFTQRLFSSINSLWPFLVSLALVSPSAHTGECAASGSAN